MAISLSTEADQLLWQQFQADRQELEDVALNALIPALDKYLAVHTAFGTNLDGVYTAWKAEAHDDLLTANTPPDGTLLKNAESYATSLLTVMNLLIASTIPFGGLKYTPRAAIGVSED